MQDTKREFARRLKAAMEAKGYPSRPAVLEREFNTRYWGKPMTLHGVRRWLEGETLPSFEKVAVLAEWLRTTPEDLGLAAASRAPRVEQRRALGTAAWVTRNASSLKPSCACPFPNGAWCAK